MTQDLSNKTQEQIDLLSNEMISRSKGYVLISIEDLSTGESKSNMLGSFDAEKMNIMELVNIHKELRGFADSLSEYISHRMIKDLKDAIDDVFDGDGE